MLKSMLQPWLFVGFTGHRKIADPGLAATAIRGALQKIRDRSGRPLSVVSSAASGGDTLFAEAAIEQNLPWTALLPFPREDFRRDFSPDEWKLAERLLTFAVQEAVEPPGAERKDAYLACGVRTVENCDVLVAWWDGEDPSGKGGTGEVVAYARDQHKPVVWIHAVTGAVVEERFDGLPPDPPTDALQPTPEDSPAGGLNVLRATQKHYDAEATAHSPKARSLLTRAIILQMVVTGIGFGVHFLSELKSEIFGNATIQLLGRALPVAMVVIGAVIVVKLVLLIRAEIIQNRHGRWHDRWMRDRVIAELCRSSVATWFLPAAGQVHQPLPVPDYGAWQRSLRLWRLLAPPQSRGLTADKADYLENRVRHQRSYF